jgi:hypothetical protein
LQPVIVDISSGKEPTCKKDSAAEAPEDFLAPVSALVTLQDPIPKALEGPATPVDALIQGLQEPTAASSAVSLPPTGARLQEPTATSSAVTPPFERVGPQEPIIASPTVIAPPSERTRPQEPITTSSTVVTPRPEQVCFITRLLTSLLMLPYSHAFF